MWIVMMRVRTIMANELQSKFKVMVEARDHALAVIRVTKRLLR